MAAHSMPRLIQLLVDGQGPRATQVGAIRHLGAGLVEGAVAVAQGQVQLRIGLPQTRFATSGTVITALASIPAH